MQTPEPVSGVHGTDKGLAYPLGGWVPYAIYCCPVLLLIPSIEVTVLCKHAIACSCSVIVVSLQHHESALAVVYVVRSMEV